MKGVVFRFLEDFVVQVAGEDALDDILDDCDFLTEESFVGPGTYPDEDFVEFVTKVCVALSISSRDAQIKFGEYCFSKLIDLHPAFIRDGMLVKDFLLSIESIIHVEVKKLYPGAVTPKFIYEDTGVSSLSMTYKSPRNLCYFMEGLLNGCGQYFDKNIEFEQTSCVHSGDESCVFDIKINENQSWMKKAS